MYWLNTRELKKFNLTKENLKSSRRFPGKKKKKKPISNFPSLVILQFDQKESLIMNAYKKITFNLECKINI